MSRALVTMILQNSDARRVPWPKKLLRLVLRQWKSIMVPKLRYTIRAYTQAKQTLSVIIMVWKLLLTSSKLTVRKRKNGSKIIILQIAAYAMAHDYVYGSQIKQGVIMVCTPDLYYQEFKVEGPELRRWKHEFLKRLDMYHDLNMMRKKEQHQ